MKSAPVLPILAAIFLAAGAAFTPRAALGYKAPSHAVLPNYDKRQRGEQRPLAPEKAAKVAELRNRVPGLQVDFDDIRGTPKHVSSINGFLSGPGGEGQAVSAKGIGGLPANDPHRALKGFLNEHAALFGHGAEVLGSARLKREFVTPHNGVRTTVHEQQLDQIAVYEGFLLSHTTRRGELAGLSSQFLPNPDQAANAGTPNRAALEAAPTISAAQAVALAGKAIDEEIAAEDVVPQLAQPQGPEKGQRFKAGLLPGEAQAKLVWLPMDATTLRLCWQVELTQRAGGERFRVLIDVQNGEALLRRCLTLHLSEATYRVFTNDSPMPLLPGYNIPTTNQPASVPRSLVTLAALSTNASPLGWINDGENETRGNNVDAHLDLNADDLPDLPRPRGSPFRVFDFAQDLSQSPASYRDAAVVQLFYWCNWMHDQLYGLGFTEAAGNFQKDNFGRGGEGGDALQADAQDGSGFNNANFTPSDDGDSPRVQMYLFNGANPSRDGDLDATIILHEYTHGLSTRLVGGGAGISALQTEGMGEGWSDFYALTLLSEESDDVNGNYVEGGYVTYQFSGLTQNYYYGIRRYPYTTDLTRNPLTFKDIDPGQISAHAGVPVSPINPINPLDANEVHHQGEVWCVTLGEARANLIQKYGFARGKQLILQLVTDGMKLGPPNPNFLQARDAILQADVLDNGGLDFNELWSAFAKRGMGFSATAPSSATTAGVHEAFDLPDALSIIPATPFISGGAPGGPLSPACTTYLLTNHTSNALSWTAKATQPWLTVSPAVGSLVAGAATNVSVCLSNGGKGLALGNYLGAVVFSNLTTKASQKREAHARVMDFASMPFVEDFESGKLRSYWMATGTGDFRSQVTTNNQPHGGRFQLTMDSQGSGDFARNEATLGLDLGGYTNVVLRFWAKQFGDEPDGPPASPFVDGADFDGVAISQDGVLWYEAQGLRDLPATNTEVFVDLDAALAAHGLGYNSTFRVRFNQYDNFSIPTDGVALDDISITGVPAKRLIVAVPKQSTEGVGTLSGQGRISLALPVVTALTVSLSSSDTSKVKVPATVTIPAGSAQATFDLFIQNNSALDGTQTAIISAAAPGYFSQSDAISVADNERGTLKVRLPRTAREGDGILVKAGSLTLSPKPTRDITVQLSSSDTNEVQVPPTVLIPAGASSATFDLSIIDDQKFDGTRQAAITAHVDNWTDGQAVMSILDNEIPAITLLAPARASEGDGVLINAGAVLISGTLPTNLIFTLSSSNTAKVLLPPLLVIPAGSRSASFNIAIVDNGLIDGAQTVTLAAGAPGFGVGTTTIEVLDNETPPLPYEPTPPNLAQGVSLSTELAWQGGVGEILVNGGFETGDFTGWVQEDVDYGSFVINDGVFDPDGPDGPLPPYDGKFSAMTDQIGGGTHTLYQDVLIPPDATTATLSWVDQIRNSAGQFAFSNQEFRVEIRDLDNVALALAFTTKPGDPATNNWTKRSFDLTGYRGWTIRVAFVETDHLGYFNVHLDDVSVRLGDPGLTSFDVYLNTMVLFGPGQYLGSTTNQHWRPPPLALNTTYYWQVLARRGAAVTRGPVWQFTTRGIGSLDHFEWNPIAGTQMVNQPFRVTLSAKDDINNTIPSFSGTATVSGLAGEGTESAVVLTEIDTGAKQRVEFANVSGRRLDLSGWQIIAYDKVSWPAPALAFTLPSGASSGPGDVFLLSYSGKAPGVYPSFFTGTNVAWNNAVVGNAVAVLLRDAGGNLVDFVCAADSDPARITNPMAIPREQWLGNPIPANTNLSLTYQRVGNTDHNDNSDWAAKTNNAGQLNPGLILPFLAQQPISLSPTSLGFLSGVWTGDLTVRQLTPGMRLLASDGAGHLGLSSRFAVQAANDLVVSVSGFPNLALAGDNLNYVVAITNTGPSLAASVILQDSLPASAAFVSVNASRGVCANVGGIVFCNLGPLAGGESATVEIALTATAPGLITNVITAARPEADGYLPNNTVSAVTAVNVPLLSLFAGPSVAEGDGGTSDSVFSVQLSSPSKAVVSVRYATSNNTALAGQDYIATNGTLVFPPGTTNQTLVVKVLGDTVYELAESFFLNLFSPTNATIAIGQARGRIVSDDLPPDLSINDVTVTESAPGTMTDAVFTVSLSGLSSLPVSVNFATSDGTASAGVDYLARAGTLTFAPGVTSQTISVTVLGNTVFKSNATFSVVLSGAAGAGTSRGQGFGTIRDNGASALDHFVWNGIPSPQYAGAPFLATIAAWDDRGGVMTAFNGSATLKAIAGSQTVTVGSGASAWQYPLSPLYHDSRIQSIYLAGEIGAAGRITAIALEVQAAPSQTVSNWTIRMKHTSSASYAQPAWEGGWTTVLQKDANIGSGGWATFFLDTPFDYDGTNNLMIDLSFRNTAYATDGGCFYTETKPLRSIFFQTDGAFGAPVDWIGSTTPPPMASNQVPNIRLLVETPVPMTPSGSITFMQGTWSGPIVIQKASSNVFLRVVEAEGHNGSANIFTVDSSADGNSNGLPDAWEVRYFGSTNAVGGGPRDDPDRDGLTNLEEFRAGTNPLDASSGLRLLATRAEGGIVRLIFLGISGKSYRLERADHISSSDWTPIADNVIGTGTNLQFSDNDAAGQRNRFYRVRLLGP